MLAMEVASGVLSPRRSAATRFGHSANILSQSVPESSMFAQLATVSATLTPAFLIAFKMVPLVSAFPKSAGATKS